MDAAHLSGELRDAGLPDDVITRVLGRLAGEPHRHHRDCIHNLSPDEQMAARGRTRQWWTSMGLAEPVQITSDDWESS
jgi:hypothetical protein